MLIKKELPKPNLDDRRFAQLVDEAMKLIPRFAPEWTDHNLSDPGIAFIDLFAWLAETSLYRLNLITDRHRLKYLKLLGTAPLPQMPARLDLTFDSEEAITLGKGREVSAKISGAEICFELEEEITVAPVKLVKIIVDELNGGIHDRTKMNTQADQFFAAFGLNAQKDCALYLGFDKPADALSFMCYLYEKDLVPPGRHGEEQAYDFNNATLQWEILTGGGSSWKGIVPLRDETKGFKKSGRVVLEKLPDWAPAKLYITEEICCWLRCIVLDSAFEYPPRIERIRLNTAPAVQGKTVTESEEWTGDGLPRQTYTLKHKTVMHKTLLLNIDGSPAEERADLDGSGPGDYHFVLKSEKGEIVFGDGLTGKTPLHGSLIKAFCYRICSGAERNIGRGYAWKVNGLEGVNAVNYEAASAGSDPETLDDAALRFITDMRTPYAAVTSSDFEYLAVHTPGLRVAKAKVLPNYHPDEGGRKGSVTVVVIPFTPLESFDSPPHPSAGFRSAVCRHMDEHRLLCTEIFVIGPKYVKVTVNISVAVAGGVQDKDIIAAAIKTLNGYLHPVLGGRDHKGWPVGRNVYRSELYEELEKIEGIKCVTRLYLSGDAGSSDSGGNLILPSAISTVYSGKHTVSITKTSGECRKKSENEGN